LRLIRLLKKDLAKEISTWVEKDLISAVQARSICQLYGVDYDSIRDHSGGYRILVSLGYLFFGLAVITLLSANWDEIPRGLRLAGLLTLTVGTHGLALRSYFAPNQSNGSGLFFLGNLFYGASIILIAQIYHLGEHMPDGVFWWALGSLPFALLLMNTWLTLFSCLLALLWFVLEYSMGFTALLFPLFIAAALYVLIRGPSSTLLFLTAVASFGLWAEATLSAAWAGERYGLRLYAEHFFVGIALFIFAYAVSQWLHSRSNSKAKDYGVLLSLWTLRFGLFVMLVLSFEGPWRELIQADWNHLASMSAIVILLLGASLWLGWNTNTLRSLVPITAFFILSSIAVILSDSSSNAIIFQAAYNVALVGSSIWLILRGIQSGISHYFFLGIATILLTAFLRYVDLIGDYIGGALLFMVFAILLLAAARYWKSNRNAEVGS
jgi:uncharacterized membrane protein